LRTGIREEDVTAFTDRVTSLVRQVENICAEAGVAPEQLPAPSSRAYRFLRELDLGKLPAPRANGSSAGTASRFALGNVLGLQDQVADRLWRESGSLSASGSARDRVRTEILGHAAAIEGICSQHRSSPGALEPPSKRVYCWLKFLSQEENLALHLEALERARAALLRHRAGPNLPATLHMVNMDALCRTRRYTNVLLLKICEGFLNAESGVWDALIKQLLFAGDQAGKGILQEYAESDEFSEVLCELESLAESPSPSTQGYVHDLEASFARVNATHFAGQMAKPKLVWNRTLTGRKFGHFRRSADTVMLSVSLDTPEIPEFVIDFVMYHELLHKKHGVEILNGRRVAHSGAYQADERRFAKFHEAERVLKELARRHYRTGDDLENHK